MNHEYISNQHSSIPDTEIVVSQLISCLQVMDVYKGEASSQRMHSLSPPHHVIYRCLPSLNLLSPCQRDIRFRISLLSIYQCCTLPGKFPAPPLSPRDLFRTESSENLSWRLFAAAQS